MSPATSPPRRPAVSPPASSSIESGWVGGVEIAELARRFGTPLYVYDLGVVDRQVDALRESLPAAVELAYAVKANPSLAIVAHLADRGLGADVASGGELATVLRAGIEPERIVMTGPGKRDDELEAAVEARIRAVTVESPGELARLEAIAARRGRRVPVMLRAARTDAPDEAVRIIGDEGAGKFGMDHDDLVASARYAAGSRHLEFLGLHAFGASNVRDADSLVAHARSAIAIARDLAARSGAIVRLVDAGGGLGIPYGPDESALDVVALGRGLADLTASWASDPILAGARLLLEPGRFLVGPSGVYVARIVDRKVVDGTTVVVLDGGIHHVLRPALVRAAHRVVGVGLGIGATEPVTVVGPLCAGLDVLARGAVMPRPAVGDLLAVLDVGAYGFTESMPLFLSHPIPAEVLVDDGRAALVRPRQDPGEWLDRQSLPGW